MTERNPEGAPHPLVLGGAIAVAVVAVSTAAILIRLSAAPTLTIAFYRLAIATVLLAPVVLVSQERRASLAELPTRDWIGLSLVGVVLAVHFGAWIESLSWTTVAASVVLVTLHPVFVGVACDRLFGEGLGRLGWIGVVGALGGGVVIAWGDFRIGIEALVGDALALVGALAAAAYFLAGRGYRRRLSLLTYVVPVYTACSVALLAWMLAAGSPVTGYPWREYAIFAALAIGPMILGHTVLNYALKYVTAPVIATAILGEPVGSTLLALVVLGEVPPLVTVLGGLVVLAGIGLVVYEDARPDPGPAPDDERPAEAGDDPGDDPEATSRP